MPGYTMQSRGTARTLVSFLVTWHYRAVQNFHPILISTSHSSNLLSAGWATEYCHSPAAILKIGAGRDIGVWYGAAPYWSFLG